MTTEEVLNEPRSTFDVRRAMIFGLGVAAVRSILPDETVRAEAEPAAKDEPYEDAKAEFDLILEETEPSLPPINDCTLIKHPLTGELEIVQLADLEHDEKLEEKRQFASIVKPFYFSYAKPDFHIETGTGSCVLTDHLPLGDNYCLYSLYGPNHAFTKMSESAYPNLQISGSETFGYAIPDKKGDDVSEDVAELLVAGRDEVMKEDSGIKYVKPVIHEYGPGETFDDLRKKIVSEGRQIYLTGFPGEYYQDDAFQRMTFELDLLEIGVFKDEDTKYVFEFKPSGINRGVPAGILPGCSGGAVGYMEDGVPHIIGIFHGYYKDTFNWAAVSLNTSYGRDFVQGARRSIDDVYKQPTTHGLIEINPDIDTPQEVTSLIDLTWFLLKHSNYPIEELDRMLRFQDTLDVYDLKLESLKFYKKAPLLIVEDDRGAKRSLLWDRNKKQFMDFNG